MMTREAVASTPASTEAERLDLLDLVFLASALIAPLELYLVHSLTLYDVMIGGLAFLIWAGPRGTAIPRRSEIPVGTSRGAAML